MFLYVRMVISILVNVFTTRLLLEALGASDYGLYNVVGGAIAMMGFLTASMSSATQRFISYAEGESSIDKVKEIFCNAQILHYGLALISIILLISAGFIFFNGILNIPSGRELTAIFVYVCLVFSTVFSIIVVPYDAVLNAHENMKVYSVIGIVDILLKFGIAFTVYYYKADKLIFYAILMALESWLLRSITQFYCKNHYDECRKTELKKYYAKDTIRSMASFAGWNMVNVACGMISLFGMSLVVNHFFGTKVNAALGIATQLSGVLMTVSTNMIKALTPVLVKREGQHNRKQVLDITYVGCKFSFLLFSFFCIPILFYLNSILRLWLHTVPDWTNIFCGLLIVGTLIEQLTVFIYQAISAQGEIREYSVVKGAIYLFPIVSSIIMFMLGNFSPYWALLNWILYKMIIGGIANIYYGYKKVGLSLRQFIRKALFPCFWVVILTGGVAIGIHVLLINTFWGWNFLLCMLLSIPIYYMLGLTSKEKKIICEYIKNRV